jgi:hypothetical protein
MKRIICIIIAATAASLLTANAQDSLKLPVDYQKNVLQTSLQQYAQTSNAAGMGLSQPESGSFTTMGIYAEGGDQHRVQEGNADRGFDFKTERFDTFSPKLFMRGSFEYNFDREYNRIWSDAMFPYDSNPYIFGSRVARRYETQDCELTFDLYTAPLGGIVSFGIRTKYEVADISGNRDPRPRTNYMDYRLVPSVLFTFGKHRHIGLDVGYRFQKEKLTGLTTVQSYPNLYYYTMSGLEHAVGTIGGYSGFERQYVGNYLIADIQYSYDSDRTKFLLSGGVTALKQNAWGDMMSSPGSYNSYDFNALADLQLIGARGIHDVSVKFDLLDGGADEYLQELRSSKDSITGATTQTWVTLYTYKNRYVVQKSSLNASWTYTELTSDKSGRKWSVGAEAGYSIFSDIYYLPKSSFGAGRFSAALHGSALALDRKGTRLELLLDAAGGISDHAVLQTATETTYSQEVLIPDLAYYKRNTISIDGGARLTFPMRFGRTAMNGYASLVGGNIFAGSGYNWYSVSLTLGLFTF